MEKFINNLYSNSNFPIILFSLIGIFIVLFIITLILALRDAKKNSLEEVKDTDTSKDEENTSKEEKKEVFEDITFSPEEEKVNKKEETDGISFDNNKKPDEEESTKEDVILETTSSIPVLKDEEISNFEEFFLENLKEKKDNVFDFSSIEDKSYTNKVKNDELDFNSDIELPKKKAEYSFKDIDGESYKIK